MLNFSGRYFVKFCSLGKVQASKVVDILIYISFLGGGRVYTFYQKLEVNLFDDFV